MDVTHLLPGWTWLYNWYVILHGWDYTIGGKKIKLASSPPKELRTSTNEGMIIDLITLEDLYTFCCLATSESHEAKVTFTLTVKELPPTPIY